MKKRRLLLGLGLAGLVAAAICLAAWLGSEGRVTRANFDLIKHGMARADVETTLGPPIDVESWSDSHLAGNVDDPIAPAQRLGPGLWHGRWRTARLTVEVSFDEATMRVKHKYLEYRQELSLPAKIRRWLGL